jgi:hypothetical protein
LDFVQRVIESVSEQPLGQQMQDQTPTEVSSDVVREDFHLGVEAEVDSDALGISDEDFHDHDVDLSDPAFAFAAQREDGQRNPSHACSMDSGNIEYIETEPPFSFPEGYKDSFTPRAALPLEQFIVAIATWSTLFSISTAAYKALVEILNSVEDLNTLKLLPHSISTLHDRLNRHLPIPRLVSKEVPLDISKLSNTDNEYGRIHLFDQRETVKDTIENTALRSVMHFGWGEIVENRSELWHGAAWWESMRASAVGSAHGETWPCYENGTPILFSDFVKFGTAGYGRVRGMAIDRRSDSATNNKLVAIVEQLVRSAELPETLRPVFLAPDNLVLVEKPLLYLDVALIHTKAEIFLAGPPPKLPAEDSLEARPVFRQNAKEAEETASIIEDLRDVEIHMTGNHVTAPIPLDCVAYIVDFKTPDNRRSIRLRHPLRGELEIMAFGRDHIIERFLLNPLPVVTLPLVLFTDGFGAYRNSYRSLLAVYTGTANLPEQERRRLHNLKLLTIGPFGSSLRDVIRALAPAGKALDRGMIMDLKIGEDVVQTYVCAYQFLHTSDLPQQNDSSGTLRQNATYGCRLCLINKEYRGDLTYNVCLHGRYQFEMEQARATVSSIAATRRVELLGRLGLAEEVSPWTIISPAINQFEIFTVDVCHSEGSGTYRMHNVFFQNH